MKLISSFFILLAFASIASGEGSDSWTPEVNFNLEGSSYTETLLWVSGNSYAYSSVVKEMSQLKIFCADSVGSKDILEILNAKYLNTKISSEQASAAIKKGLVRKFPCI